jgi:hypothetical protein
VAAVAVLAGLGFAEQARRNGRDRCASLRRHILLAIAFSARYRVAFDVAGAGNVMMVAGLRPMTKVMDKPPEPKVRTPVLDPTRESL